MRTELFVCEACGHEKKVLFRREPKSHELKDVECPLCREFAMRRSLRGMNQALIAGTSLGVNKAPRQFREFVDSVRRAHPGSQIKDTL